MIDSKLVSVIIPVYNGSKYIGETLSSVLHQTYKNIEVIIIDDGSKDNLKEVIAPFLIENKVYFHQKDNTGVSNSRNFGFSMSKGNYVIFLDADDILASNFIKNKLGLIEGFECVGSKIDYFKNNPSQTLKTAYSITENIIENVLFYSSDLASCPSSYLFKADFLRKNSITFNERLSSIADKDFLLQIAKHNGKCILDKQEKSRLLYRIHENNMSGKLNKKLIKDNEAFYKMLEKENWIDNKTLTSALSKGYGILYKSYFKIFHLKEGLRYMKKYLYSLKKASKIKG